MSSGMDFIVSKPVVPDNKNKKIFGVVVGIVTKNNGDPENMERVKVKFPWLSDQNESYWARIATTMAGAQRGTYFLPEVDDEVLVAFEHGNINAPYVLGALWNGQDAPPVTNSDKKNNIRQITSRAGHKIIFDDNAKDKKAMVTIKTAGGHSIVLDDTDKKGKVTITTIAGHSLVLDDTDKKGNVTVTTVVGHSLVLDDANNKGKVKISTSGGHALTMDDDNKKLVLEEANGNKIEMDSNGTKITDANGNKITGTSSSLTLENSGGKKVELGSSSVKVNDGALEVM